jgi:hypothetical protein
VTTAPSVVDVAVNPGNTAQRYVLWSTGRVDAIGGAPTVTTGPVWYDRSDQPVGVALWISNWSNGQGYVLDYTGKFNSINGAATLGVAGYVTGVPQAAFRKYIDWAWDPAGTGKGYVVDQWGQLYAFGGATVPTRTGPRWGHPVCKRIRAIWSPSVKVILLDQYGGLWADFNAVIGNSEHGVLRWPGWDAARDFVVIDWTTGKGYVLDLYGGHNAWGGASAVSGWRYRNGADVGRRHHCLDPVLLIFWVIWEGCVLYEFTNSVAPTVIAGAGTTEVQQVAITGAPTGGTFTLVYGGVTSGTIAWNASAATVQTTLRAMSSIGSTGVTVTGGPGPGTPWVVTFGGTLAYTNVAQFTLGTNSLTGGTSPAPVFSTTTAGINGTPAATTTTTHRPTLAWSYSDPLGLSQIAWQLYVYTSTFVAGHDMSDPSVWAASATVAATGTQPSQRGIVANTDLPNNTYVLFVRSRNYGGVWSAWSNYTWTQTVPPPAAPTGLTATADNTNFRVALSCSCNTTGVTNVTFQYSDDGGVTWNEVRGSEQLPVATTMATKDYDVPLGVARRYRVFTYNLSPRVVSLLSATVSATVTNQKYVLTNTSDATQGGEVFVQDPPTWSKKSDAGVFTGVEAVYPVVVSDGVPKARKQDITVECDSKAAWLALQAIVESDDTLLFRDPFGDVMYCRVVGDYTRTQQRRRPYPTETSPLRHNHLVKIPLQEITPPLVLDVGYTIPPGPVVPT